MAQRGRKSQAQKSAKIAQIKPELKLVDQTAPADLSDEEAKIWAAIIDRMADDWFGPDVEAMLKQYCRHCVSSGRVAKMISTLQVAIDQKVEACEDPDEKIKTIMSGAQQVDRLFKMQDRESRALTSIGTKLRITPQSTRRQSGIKKQAEKEKMPWEFDG